MKRIFWIFLLEFIIVFAIGSVYLINVYAEERKDWGGLDSHYKYCSEFKTEFLIYPNGTTTNSTTKVLFLCQRSA